MATKADKSKLDLDSIVYATDFSVCSQNAGLYASELAHYFSAKLIVAHAFTLSQAAMEAEIDHTLISHQRRDLEFLLSKKAAELAGGRVPGTPALVEGDPGELLPKLADLHAPSMIVLGTHGGGWIERGIIGSVAERILRSTPWPCVTVGPQVPPAPKMTFPFKRILYATDFSPAAAHAATYAVSFAQAFGSSIDVLNVIQGDAVSHPDRLSEITKRFYSALDGLVPEQAKAFCEPRTFVDVGNAHHQILQHIKEHSIDLLVLGISKTPHLFLEMRTSEVFPLILDAKCPVLTITARHASSI
jgi:nucleotide-binding universal stress UspA family protein